jgi:TctA family transporter
VVLGIVLGPMVERNFMQSMIASDGSLALFFSRPGSAILGTTTVLLWLAPLGLWAWRRTRRAGDGRRHS